MTLSTTMVAKVAQYLKFRRGLGYQLRTAGRLLEQFARYADSVNHSGPLTTELALRWAQLPEGADRLYQARRLEILRCFARHLAAVEPGTQIPGRNLLGSAHRRVAPHIFSAAELKCLMSAAGQLQPHDGLRPRTYRTLVGLLTATGLRISEALRLTRPDFDSTLGTLTIRETKFGKSRLVPLHPTTTAALIAYAGYRDTSIRQPNTDHFFLSERGAGLPYSTVQTAFRQLCDGLSIVGTGSRRPRLHDLRHTFACRRVEAWYDAGADLNHAVTALSVYLGHAKVTDTYWYLTATPSLLARAAERFESFAQLGKEVQL